VTNAITRLDVQSGINACLVGNDNTACETFGIDPAAGAAKFDNLTSSLTNVGSQDTSGIDFNLAYTFEGLGLDWKISNDTTYLLNFEQDNEDYTGTIDGNFGAYAKVRNNFSIQASQGDWSVMYFNRYIGSMDDHYTDYDENDNPIAALAEADSVLYHNISGTYHINNDMTVIAGVKNLTDEEPSSVTNGSDGGTVPEVYDVIGRQYYAGFSMKF
jgi:iron complex outermembrane receptor protein